MKKQEKIVLGGDQNSQNSGPHLDVEDDEEEGSYGYGQDISNNMGPGTTLTTP